MEDKITQYIVTLPGDLVLLCCGSRRWKDRAMIAQTLDEIRRTCRDGQSIVMVEGEAAGADTICRQYALKVGIPVHPHPADWNQYGPGAGPIRNQEMIDEENPHLVVAFHDDLTLPGGTVDMIEQARIAEIPVVHVHH